MRRRPPPATGAARISPAEADAGDGTGRPGAAFVLIMPAGLGYIGALAGHLQEEGLLVKHSWIAWCVIALLVPAPVFAAGQGITIGSEIGDGFQRLSGETAEL